MREADKDREARQERCNVCKAGGMQDRREARQEGCNKKEGCKAGRMQDRTFDSISVKLVFHKRKVI